MSSDKQTKVPKMTPKIREIRDYVVRGIKYTSVGGYPLALLLKDGSSLCPDCAHDNRHLIMSATMEPRYRTGWESEGVTVVYEGLNTCYECGEYLETAYGEHPEGYRSCSCRDCMEIAIGRAGRPAMCNACQEAGCEGSGECEAMGAYDTEDETND